MYVEANAMICRIFNSASLITASTASFVRLLTARFSAITAIARLSIILIRVFGIRVVC